MNDSINFVIMKRIRESPENSVFFLSDFYEEGTIESVKKVFLQARQRGILTRLAHGIYVKPKKSKFGIVPPSLEYIATEIAKRDHVKIIPSGYTAVNLLGLSTQVPMSLSYLTTGSTREVKIGTRSIKFRHAAPKNFAAVGMSVPLIIQALKEIGKENIGSSEITALKAYLKEAPDKQNLYTDLSLAPRWIQKIVKPLIPETE